MKYIPSHIKLKFFQLMNRELKILEFEQWIYNTVELENILEDETYLDLISFNYKKEGARYELFTMLAEIVGLGEFESYKLKTLLQQARVRDSKLPSVLERFYDEYCRGYGFLTTLGMDFGLTMTYLPAPYNGMHWSDLVPQELATLVQSITPELDIELKRVEDWLNKGKIVLTGEQDELGYYEYLDFRSETEKLTPAYNKILVLDHKPWWKLWN